MIDFNKVIGIFTKDNNARLIVAGIISTLILSIFGTVVGLFLGVFLAYGKNVKTKATDNIFKRIGFKIIKGFCQLYSVVLRGTPMMVQALIFKYGCLALGFNWADVPFHPFVSDVFNGWFFAGLIVITFNTAAYMSEIVQSGLNGVDVGQVEGARSLGMKASDSSFFVVLPQAIRNSLPTIGNELIVNIKDSSVLNVIATSELYYRVYNISGESFAFVEGYLVLAIIYLIMTLLAAFVLKLIEKKLDGQKISLNPFGRFKRGIFA